MNIVEIQGVLDAALAKRSPRWEPGAAPREKLTAIEDFMLEAAYSHGDLHEALYWLDKLVQHFKERVDAISGWEVGLPSGKPAARVTAADVLAAKRQIDPEAFEMGGEARRLRDSVRQQIARFEYEQGAISRLYSVISGS